MIILGIETSCDETACAILKKEQDGIHILSNVVTSSASLQAKYGGIIPEQAAREQIKAIIPVIETAINDSGLMINDIDAIAVTEGPGLIGSLLVGVETAKTLSVIWKKPLIPVNHLIGHFYANWIDKGIASTSLSKYPLSESSSRSDTPSFPCIGLLVSGGHTDLILMTGHSKYKYLGGTRDDAAGECFDKCARLLGLPYPGGPEISRLALQGRTLKFDLPRPMIDSNNFDFSFSGLKTAVANLIHTSNHTSEESKPTSEVFQLPEVKCNLAASIEQAIVDVLVAKTIKAAKVFSVKNIMLGGGVASNQKLVSDLKIKIENLPFGFAQGEKLKINLHIPSANLCTDNAAMIASAAFFQKPVKNPLNLQADPNLSL